MTVASSPDATDLIDSVRRGLPPGWSAARIDLDVDVAAVVAAVRGAEAHLGSDPQTEAEVLGDLTGSQSDVTANVLVRNDSGAPVGVVIGSVDREAFEYFLDVYVDPATAGSVDRHAQVLNTLVEGGIARARQWSHQVSDRSWTARAGSISTDAPYVASLRRSGMATVRRFWRMHLDLTGYDVTPDPWPPGVVLHGVDGDRMADLLLVRNESFADHWNTRPWTLEEYAELLAGFAGAAPDRRWLVTVDGDPAAFCLLDDSQAENGNGYVRSLGVRRAYRGRGIARTLLQLAFRDSQERGRRGITLTVDSDSPTGATRLYEGLGMTAVEIIDAWSLHIG